MIDGNTSDGHHTFNELYDHRCMLFIRLCLRDVPHAAWKHHLDDWFLLYLELPEGQISYHCPVKYLHFVEDKIKQVPHYNYDGHNSEQVLERLMGQGKNCD
jgi:hypothetical protein